MTKKDYVAMAKIFASENTPETKSLIIRITNLFIDISKKDNKKFDPIKFRKACGL